ncbi:protein YIPF6-like protein [Corchorus olitorius]|uniref:Protein YIPF6-like protein n=1 Tax=Corchorus olitorius TaxID=93759 RepID=A0A1R3GWW2_9ROSI|nr:protein YIPF6-like protein [Corchorus olitorius]
MNSRSKGKALLEPDLDSSNATRPFASTSTPFSKTSRETP